MAVEARRDGRQATLLSQLREQAERGQAVARMATVPMLASRLCAQTRQRGMASVQYRNPRPDIARVQAEAAREGWRAESSERRIRTFCPQHINDTDTTAKEEQSA